MPPIRICSVLWPILVLAPSLHNSDSITPDDIADKYKTGLFFAFEDRLLNKADFCLLYDVTRFLHASLFWSNSKPSALTLHCSRHMEILGFHLPLSAK